MLLASATTAAECGIAYSDTLGLVATGDKIRNRISLWSFDGHALRNAGVLDGGDVGFSIGSHRCRQCLAFTNGGRLLVVGDCAVFVVDVVGGRTLDALRLRNGLQPFAVATGHNSPAVVVAARPPSQLRYYGHVVLCCFSAPGCPRAAVDFHLLSSTSIFGVFDEDAVSMTFHQDVCTFIGISRKDAFAISIQGARQVKSLQGMGPARRVMLGKVPVTQLSVFGSCLFKSSDSAARHGMYWDSATSRVFVQDVVGNTLQVFAHIQWSSQRYAWLLAVGRSRGTSRQD